MPMYGSIAVKVSRRAGNTHRLKPGRYEIKYVIAHARAVDRPDVVEVTR